MGTTDISLQRIFRQLMAGNVGLAIAETETYLSAWPNPQTAEKVKALKGDYQLMTDYWKRDMKDPQMAEQYQLLLQRLYAVVGNIAIHRHITGSSFLKSLYSGARSGGQPWTLAAIRSEMEDFVASVAMLELEPEQQRQQRSQEIYKQHYQQMTRLFNYIVTSHIWTNSVAEGMQQLLLSPTVDSNDQQLVVAAVTLSLLNRFDIAKFRLLANVYCQAVDGQVRQRALVGWALGIDDDCAVVYPEMRDIVATVLASKRACRELKELQIQLVYTLEAEKDSTKIHEEIIPDIIKNNDQFRITRNGIEEVEDDPLEDVLHPDAAEERMEKLEASIKRMLDMQKQGADIYFGGFSQMKRYPFFYDMANWLVPFFMQHPDIRQFAERAKDHKFIRHILEHGPFCNSDKYSFLIAFQQVVERLPDSMRDVLEQGDATLAGMEEVSGEESQSAPYQRRIYLMDLYRFFKLFPNRAALFNPFDTQYHPLGKCLFFASQLLCGTPLDADKRSIAAMLAKRRMGESLEELIGTFPDDMRDAQYYLWLGDYDSVLRVDPDNEQALSRRARRYFDQGRFEQANDDYERLHSLHPEKVSYMLNNAVCMVNLHDYEEALKLLYQLNYEHEDDVNVLRVMAWALTCDGKLEQAERMYRQLVDGGQTSREDYLNYGCCLWVKGDKAGAAQWLSKSVEGEEEPCEKLESLLNRQWLSERGITDIEVNMMLSLVLC